MWLRLLRATRLRVVGKAERTIFDIAIAAIKEVGTDMIYYVGIRG
jgi:hypothetical protein